MQEIVDFLTSAKIMELATEPRILLAVAVVAIIAVLMRWKMVLLLLFAIGGVVSVVRFTRPVGGSGAVDTQMLLFAGGILAVAVILIYFLFIKGD